MKKILVILISLLLTGLGVNAQNSGYEDFTYPHTAVKERKAVPYRYIREANVKWSKRIHRVIDTREKQNKVMHWPRNPFHTILWKSVMEGVGGFAPITAYEDDTLTQILTPEDIVEKTSIETTTQIQDPNYPDDPWALIDTTYLIKFEYDQIKKYRIMEDWIFDYNYSDFRARIIAIAPLFNPPTESGIDLGEQTLFWVKMDDLRPILAQQEVFNAKNDAGRLSFDHWFQMRQFNSFIVKESNMYDLDIKYFDEFKDDGVEALLKSDAIKNDLFILEHDLWEY